MSDELKKDGSKSGNEATKTADKQKSSEKAKGKNFFVEQFTIFKAEFKKIVWPSKNDLIKQTITVIVISLLFGAYISLADGIFAQALQQFVRFLG